LTQFFFASKAASTGRINRRTGIAASQGVFRMVHYLAVAALAASTFAVTPAKVKWQADYGKALAATRSDQRPLLVILDNPADPEAAFEPKLLAAEGEHGQVLKSYRLCRVDVSTEYGKKVADAFGAKEFPQTTIIDKTGSTVLFKKLGQMAGEEWQTTLARFEKGEQMKVKTVGYRGTILNAQSRTVTNPSFCPSCQRRAMGL
jgi:hypothetical protein